MPSSIPSTLEDIKSYISALPTFPVDRSKAVRYGYTDSTALPLVQFAGLTGTPTYTTAGPSFWDTTFTVSVFHTSNANALALARQTDAVLTGQQVTTKATYCALTGYQVVQEAEYRFHVQLTYTVTEGV